MLLALAATLSAGAIGTAQAAPAMPGAGSAAEQLNVVEQAQYYVFRRRHYCFYLDGWHGPGWYWCGYAQRSAAASAGVAAKAGTAGTAAARRDTIPATGITEANSVAQTRARAGAGRAAWRIC